MFPNWQTWRTDQSTALHLVTYLQSCFTRVADVTSRRRLRSSDPHRLEVPPVLEISSGGQLSPSVRPHNPATGFRPPSATVVSAEPFSHGTGTLRCLQKEMATYRHWSVLVARPRRCLTLSNPVPWQNWMVAYLGYTLRMKTLFRGWPDMVHDTHTRRRRLQAGCNIFIDVIFSCASVKWTQFTLENCGTTRRGGDCSRLDRDTGGDGVTDSNADGAAQSTPTTSNTSLRLWTSLFTRQLVETVIRKGNSK